MLPVIPQAALGSIYAAVIAGGLTYLGLIIVKEHRISEFRQQWIDSLRSDIADLIAQLSLIASHYRHWDEDQYAENVTSLSPNFVSANLALMRTRLRLNPSELDSKDILKILETAQEIFNDENPNLEDLEALEKPLILATQKVLKAEWNRVRRGEPIFVISKWLALFFTIAALAVIYTSIGAT